MLAHRVLRVRKCVPNTREKSVMRLQDSNAKKADLSNECCGSTQPIPKRDSCIVLILLSDSSDFLHALRSTPPRAWHRNICSHDVHAKKDPGSRVMVCSRSKPLFTRTESEGAWLTQIGWGDLRELARRPAVVETDESAFQAVVDLRGRKSERESERCGGEIDAWWDVEPARSLRSRQKKKPKPPFQTSSTTQHCGSTLCSLHPKSALCILHGHSSRVRRS